MTPLLLGIFIAAVIFAAVLYGGYQAVATTGFSRFAHLGSILATIGVMAGISYQSPGATSAAGALLAVAALAATYHTSGWSRLLPLTLCAFGAVAVMGMPFN